MIERQGRGMQRLALEGAQGLDELLASRRAACAKRPPYTGSPTIGYFQMRQVQANLVRSPGLEFHAKVGVGPEALEHPVVRDRRPAALAHRHAQPIAAMAPDRLIDGAARRS